jgi:hypothetical protein
VRGYRLTACLAPAAFAVLAGVLGWSGAVPVAEAAWAAFAALAGFVPSGLVAPAGWRRRAAEAVLVPAAAALALVADPVTRRMAVPALLLAAAWAATGAALPRAAAAQAPWLVVALALAARTATGLAFTGEPRLTVVLTLAATAAVAWGVARRAGGEAGLAAALLAGALPLQRSMLLTVAVLVAGIVLERSARAGRRAGVGVGAAVATVGAVAILAAALGPWGGVAPARGWAAAGLPAALAGLAALLAAPWLAPGVAGAALLGATFAAGPVQAPPVHRPARTLTAAKPRVVLAAGDATVYVVGSSLANAARLRQGTVVAEVVVGEERHPLRAGVETVEWARVREDISGVAAHGLPPGVVWRTGAPGRDALWTASGRVEIAVPAGIVPSVVRATAMPPEVALTVTAGPTGAAGSTRGRLFTLLLGAAIAVAVLQVSAGSWRAPLGWLPWLPLAVASLAARTAVEPLRLLGERYGADLLLAALLLAWAPAARSWLARGRRFAAAAALLVPIAVATPVLTPPLGDEPYHILLLDSLVGDRDLEVSNNYDLQRIPAQAIYRRWEGTFVHSPALAVLLAPAYALAGRPGAAGLLALAGATLIALAVRRMAGLGVGGRATAAVCAALLLSYPLLTFSSQLWVEVPGALLAMAALLWGTGSRSRPLAASLAAVVATLLKTRLALVTIPVAAAAWWVRLPRRRRALALVAGAVTAGLAWAAATVVVSDPLDPLGRRRFVALVPHDAHQAVISAGGLLFDAAAGMTFAAPLLVLGIAGGTAALWRRGGPAERALLLGAVATFVPLLANPEWRAGDSPPFRYLVPLWPWFALAAATAFATPHPRRRLAWLLAPPTLLVSWVAATRPHLLVNAGDGGWWLADVLARRFQVDARHLFPSFLRPSPAVVVVPLVLVAVVAALVVAARRWPVLARGWARQAVALWLLAAAGLLVALHGRTDRVVEVEDPQVSRLGGVLEPPEGTFSRFRRPNGWRLAGGDAVEVPLRLPAGAAPRLEGWLDGAAARGATLEVSWDDRPAVAVPVAGSGRSGLTLPAPPGDGRHRLRLRLAAPAGGTAVLDRLVVAP